MNTTVVPIPDGWWQQARKAVESPRYAEARDRDRLIKGFVAELAVVDLIRAWGQGDPQWLSLTDTPAVYRNIAPRARPHLGDIMWCGEEIDVKLTARGQDALTIKAGAGHLHHVFLTWKLHMSSFEVHGVLLRNQPETFGPPLPLSNFLTGEEFRHLTNHGRRVNGWKIPWARLQPLSTLRALGEAA